MNDTDIAAERRRKIAMRARRQRQMQNAATAGTAVNIKADRAEGAADPAGEAAASNPVAVPANDTPARPATPLRPINRKAVQSARPMALGGAPQSWAIEALRIDIAAETRKKRRRFLLRMALWVGLPMLLMSIYIFVYATPRYISEFQITYQTYNQPSSSATSSLLSSLTGAGAGTTDMTQVLQAFMISDTMLDVVDRQLGLRAHLSDPKIDWLDRMPADATREKFLNYFQARINVDDMSGGYLVVDVDMFDPAYSRAVATAMAKAADDMVENLTARARSEEVRVAEEELKRTQKQLIKATQDQTAFQNEHRDLDPTTMASQLDTVIGGLEGQLSQLRAELTRDQSFMAPSSPQILTLNSQISALEKQIQSEKQRLAAPERKTSAGGPSAAGSTVAKPYSDIIAEYTALQLEVKFASDSYLTAKGAYDMAKADSMRKENFVESFVTPNLPQKSLSPDPKTYLPATFLLSLFASAVFSLLLGSFRDKAGV